MSTTTTPLGNWNYPTAVRFGVGRISELADACRDAGITRPLLVTDPGLAKLPMINQAQAANKADGLPTTVFSDIQPNPVADNVEAGVTVFKDGNHNGVIAWGGGSAMDAGKAIAMMAGQTRPIWDFEDIGDNWTRAEADAIAPVIAIPTTSGTGSEVGRASVITNTETHTKKIIFHPRMMPQTVICDPALVAGLPSNLTAWTGMDALVHCLEAYCSPGYHPMAEGIAVEGLRLIKDWLPKAVADGADLEARAHMMSAAAMGATAFQKGLGAIHSLSHPVGAIYDAHHGLANAVFTPYVLVHNRPAIEDRLDRLARWLGFNGNGYTAILDWILELRSLFSIPHTADALGVEEHRLEELAAMAADDPTAGSNPVPVDAAAMLKLYRAAMAGTM
jgi:alcohol dehydrogenase